MIGSNTPPTTGTYDLQAFLAPTAEAESIRFHQQHGRLLFTLETPGGHDAFEVHPTMTISDDERVEPVVGVVGLSRWLPFMTPEWPECSISKLQAAIAAHEEAIRTGGSPDLDVFGRIALGLKRSERWTEALSTALLSDWISPLHDGTGLGLSALDRLRSEARTVHTQLIPLWERRQGGTRVLPLETPVGNSTTLRDRLADRSLPEDQVLDQVPGDARLAAVMAALKPADRDVLVALGHRGVATWAEAADLTGSERPDEDGKRVRLRVGRKVAEFRRRDALRIDGPTGLWSPAQDGGVR